MHASVKANNPNSHSAETPPATTTDEYLYMKGGHTPLYATPSNLIPEDQTAIYENEVRHVRKTELSAVLVCH